MPHRLALHRDRNALEAFAFLFLILITAPGTFGWTELPPSLAAAPVVGYVAGWFMLIGCAAGLAALAWRNDDVALPIEQGAVGLIFLACFVYVFALTQRVSFRSFGGFIETLGPVAWAVGTTVAIAVFCAWRFWQVRQYVKLRRSVMQTLSESRGRTGNGDTS